MAFTPIEITIGGSALGGGVIGGLLLKIVWDWLKIRRNGGGAPAPAQPHQLRQRAREAGARQVASIVAAPYRGQAISSCVQTAPQTEAPEAR